jgi:PE-PPE domain/PE family
MVIVDLSALADAAASLGSVGSSLGAAHAVAELPTTGILAPAADEVSAMITTLFNSRGHWCQWLAGQAEAFRRIFTQTLVAASEAYQNTEWSALEFLWTETTQLEQPLIPLLGDIPGFNPASQLPIPPLPTAPVGQTVALLLGGTDYPVLGSWYPGMIQQLYFPGVTSYGSIFTPEQFWPLTPQLGALTLEQSIHAGVPLLNQAITTGIANGNKVLVWTTSQSATVATNEIRDLMGAGSPYTDKLSFILTGNPNNPDGGLLERFVGAYIPGLDLLFNGATPPNAPYQIQVFTNQYDGISDFPEYPLNVVSDANAVFGFLFGAHDYAPYAPYSTPIQLPTSPGYTGSTTYMFDLTQNLPLVTPLREYLPAPYGNALADLLQPDLRVIVDMGYGSGEYPNLPTPARLIEIPNPFTIIPDLAAGAMQGPQAALVDLGLLPQSMLPNAYPYLPALDPDLNFNLGQSSVTGLALLTGAEGALARDLGLIPPWDLA